MAAVRGHLKYGSKIYTAFVDVYLAFKPDSRPDLSANYYVNALNDNPGRVARVLRGAAAGMEE